MVKPSTVGVLASSLVTSFPPHEAGVFHKSLEFRPATLAANLLTAPSVCPAAPRRAGIPSRLTVDEPPGSAEDQDHGTLESGTRKCYREASHQRLGRFGQGQPIGLLSDSPD
jgi:hypothetical protein